MGGSLNIAPPVCSTFHGGRFLIESSCFSLTPLDFPARLDEDPGACCMKRSKCFLAFVATITLGPKTDAGWRIALKCCLPVEWNVQVDNWAHVA